MWAASYNKLDVVKCLISRGASVKTKNNGWTPLLWASKYQLIDTVEYLICIKNATTGLIPYKLLKSIFEDEQWQIHLFNCI
jgi:ankyrin repeat protein